MWSPEKAAGWFQRQLQGRASLALEVSLAAGPTTALARAAASTLCQQLLQGPGLHCQDFCLVPQARSLLLGNLALFHKVHAQKHSASHSSTVYLHGLLFCQIRKTSPRVCFRLIKYKLRSMLSRAERKPWALLAQMQYSTRLGHTSVPGTHDFPCGPWEGEERQ